MTAEDILLALGSLSKPELKQIATQINFLLRNDKSPKPNSYVSEVIYLYAQKWTQVPPKHVIDKKELGEKLSSAGREIEALAKEFGFDRKDTIKLCQVLLEASVYRLRETPIPVSFTTVINQLENPRELLDQAFPGYASSKVGLFKKVILNV